MRRKFVAGNWKMNTTFQSAQALAREVASAVAASNPAVDVAVCPPAPFLWSVKQILAGSPVLLGGQNAYFEKSGAFTGETSLDMLLDVGCEWVILGHSERRQFFGDTDAIINKKVAAAIAQKLGIMFCVGEVLEDRQANRTEAVLTTQLEGGLAGFTSAQLSTLVIAYEPVWAIGTGVTASPEQAESAHAFIRNWMASRFDAKLAAELRIQYGGSVKPENAKEILSKPNVDGALVGGASLKSDQFMGIVNAAAELSR
ncbi:MAG: triosephosphate isomerase [Schlesneria sp.]|nr:triosephosphate isomerase [Schlesneria sp.]